MFFSFGDITYNYQEDMANWWKYRIQGDVPAWMYYVKFEKMSEDEAKAAFSLALSSGNYGDFTHFIERKVHEAYHILRKK